MLAILIGLAIGVGLPMQTSINSRLRSSVGSPFMASLISFAVGTVFLGVITLIDVHTLGFSPALFTSQPLWMWIGGMIGSLYVLGNVYLAPAVGTGLAVVIVLVGLMAGSLLIDQFGWFASKRNPVTGAQLLGLLVMILGVALIRLF
ncbi:DMT family transporter [Lactiplantibacillus pentosus]|uniref:DMT family transporter n=1 Tax=Lactiplantibacillus pentosus TaxID=1589 RepID=UPI0021A5B8BC|nr:DMT family transporter [Lactiplantibacillus pentosus]MCT3277869.1 DMT family transporter [Lactiplantibacillus pentosus]